MKSPRFSLARLMSRAPIRTLLLAVAAAGAVASPAARAADVSVSVGVNEPGFYGQINIGNAPPPVIYQQPVVIVHERAAPPMAPVYLRVPPGHEKQWSKYCGRYNACGRPVYFVRYDVHQEQRFHDRYVQERDYDRGHDHWHDGDRGHGHGPQGHDNHDDRHDDRHDEHRDHDHGNGHGHDDR